MFKKLFYVCLWLCFLSSTAYTDTVPVQVSRTAPAAVSAVVGR